MLNSPTVTSWGNFVVANLRFLVLTPFILNLFNTRQLAVWFFLGTLNSFVLLFSKGLSSSFVRIVSYVWTGATEIGPIKAVGKTMAEGKPNWPLMERVFSTLQRVFGIMGMGAFALSAVLLFFSIENLAPSDFSFQEKAWMILTVSLAIGANVYGQVYYVVLIGTDRVSIFNLWNIAFSFIGLLLSLMLLWAGAGFLSLVLLNQAVALAMVVRTHQLVRRIDRGQLRLTRQCHFDGDIIRAAWQPTWRASLSNFSYQATLQGPGIVYAQIGSAAGVASFLLALRVITLLMQFANAPFSSRIPFISRQFALGEINAIAHFFRRRMAIVLFLFAVSTLLAGMLAQPMLRLVDSQIAFLRTDMWLLMGLFWLIDRINAMHNALHNSTNNVIYHWHHFIAFCVSLPSVILMASGWGLTGLIVAQTVPRLLVFRLALVKSGSRLVGMDWRQNMIQIAAPIIGIYCGVASWLAW